MQIRFINIKPFYLSAIIGFVLLSAGATAARSAIFSLPSTDVLAKGAVGFGLSGRFTPSPITRLLREIIIFTPSPGFT